MKNAYILVDNRPAPVSPSRFLTEHGLAIFFEADNKKWLVDTGASGAFLENATLLGLDIAQVDCLILSHNHNDHTGGLEHFFKHNKTASVYLSEWIKKSSCYSIKEGTPKDIGIDREWLRTYENRFVYHPKQNVFLTKNVALLGDIPSIYPLPMGNTTLGLQYDGKHIPDPFDHELALLVHTPCGEVILSSCTHKGILNTLEAARVFAGKPPSFFIGGLHLKDDLKSKEQLATLSDFLKKEYPKLHIYTGHCTGDASFGILEEQMPNQVTLFHSGYKFGQFCQQIM